MKRRTPARRGAWPPPPPDEVGLLAEQVFSDLRRLVHTRRRQRRLAYLLLAGGCAELAALAFLLLRHV